MRAQLHEAASRQWSAGSVGFEDAADFVADLAENFELFFLGAGGVSRVVKGPVVAVELAGEDGADLVSVAADGDDGLDGLREEFVQVFGSMLRDVDSDFGHGLDGEWMDVAGGFAAGAGDTELAFGSGTEDAFSQVAAAGVASAENENERLVLSGGHLFCAVGVKVGIGLN